MKNKEKLLSELLRVSHHFGSDPEYVIEGGGNTSVKVGPELHIKASGTRLGTLQPCDIVALDRSRVAALMELDSRQEEHLLESIVTRGLMEARIESSGPKPSVEATLHNLLEATYVVHTHPTILNAFGCSIPGRKLLQNLAPDLAWVPYVNPGLRLAVAVRKALETYRQHHQREPAAIVMANHGLIVGGDSPQSIIETTDRLMRTLRKHLPGGKTSSSPGTTSAPPPDDWLPAMRGLWISATGPCVIRLHDDSETLAAVQDVAILAALAKGPPIPDVIVYNKSMPWMLQPQDLEASRLKRSFGRYCQKYGAPPKVALIRGVGMVCAGESLRQVATCAAMQRDAFRIVRSAIALGGYRPIGAAARKFIDNWDAESYRRKKAGGKNGGPLDGKIALVTGGSRGFGAGIARGLAAAGAHVLIVDIDREGAERLSLEINRAHGYDLSAACVADISDSGQIAEMARSCCRLFGGLDIFVANAGVVRAGSIFEVSEEDFNLCTRINYSAFFLGARIAAKIMIATRSTFADYMGDILQINSKSGLQGSSRNSAYSGSKFGAIGLVQSFALELAEHGIKVNAICPGNYFDGPLWSDPRLGLFKQYLRAGKVPGAKTAADVRKAYEAKIPMGRGCLPEDVIVAILYLCRQSYETGQALPVGGGQVMLR